MSRKTADPTAHELTELLLDVTEGAGDAADRLFESVYQDLRRLAASYLRDERADHTLQPTALVHEAYLRLIDQSRVDWKSRSHFFAVAARAMRRLLVDHARARARQKRGGDRLRMTLTDRVLGKDAASLEELIAIDQALERLASAEPEKARVVELRFFGGLTVPETAEALGVGVRTVERHWLYARAWLFRRLSEPSAPK